MICLFCLTGFNEVTRSDEVFTVTTIRTGKTKQRYKQRR